MRKYFLAGIYLGESVLWLSTHTVSKGNAGEPIDKGGKLVDIEYVRCELIGDFRRGKLK